MESLVFRAATIYIIIFIILRISGKRTLGEMTTFDLVLLLIISESTQNALINDDKSIVGSALVISTLVGIDIIVSYLTRRFKVADRLLNNVPVIILQNGTPLWDRMKKLRVEVDDILEAARKNQGIESLDQIKFAVLEKDGEISILPKDSNKDIRSSVSVI